MAQELNIKVTILTSDKYENRYEGKTAIIEKVSCGNSSVGVRIDNHYNVKSSTGLFWFDANEVEKIEKGDKFMMFEDFTVVGVKFLDGSNTDKEYFYALYEYVEVGDLVVVNTGHHGIALARVSSIGKGNKDDVKHGREVISRVDETNHKLRVERRTEIARLKSEMDKRVKELQDIAIYEMLAEKDPSLADMLGTFKSLLGS